MFPGMLIERAKERALRLSCVNILRAAFPHEQLVSRAQQQLLLLLSGIATKLDTFIYFRSIIRIINIERK